MRTLVTGASGALGRELARLFSAHGHVIISGRNAERLAETEKLCGPKSTTMVCGDLNDSSVRNGLAMHANCFGIHYAILCAGEYVHGEFDKINPSWALGENNVIDRIIESNLTDTIKLTYELLPALKRRYWTSTIVFINSLAGKNASKNEALYSASKFGLDGFAKALRLELRPNVRVMTVYLGAMKTDMMVHRPDFKELISPIDAAEAIHDSVITPANTLQIEDVTIGRGCSQP